jgi:hypothetical protein
MSGAENDSMVRLQVDSAQGKNATADLRTRLRGDIANASSPTDTSTP